MSTLEKWNPFKFLRKSKEEQKGDKESGEVAIQRPATEAASLAVTDPFTAMSRMMDAMLRDPFFRDPFAHFGEVDRWFGDFSPSTFGVSMDVVDEGDGIRVDFELPGMSKDDVTLTIDNGTLVLKGEKRHDSESTEEGVYRSERYFGSVQRSVPLPDDLDFEAAEARFDKGVLSVRFPKKARSDSGARRIPVK